MLTFLQIGDWGPGDVGVECVPSGRRIVPEVEALIQRAWADAVARPGVHLFDGPMCRLERWGVSPDGNRLQLALSETSYKPFFGTNMSHPELEDRFGPDVMANPVGVSPALETSDGFVLFGQRNGAVAYYPNRLHPFAGALDPADAGNVFDAVRRELSEELSLSNRDVVDVRCTGLVREPALRQTELVFHARCALTCNQTESRLDTREHGGMVAIPATEEAINSFLADRRLTPVALASLLLWGRVRFGTEWFTRHSRRECNV